MGWKPILDWLIIALKKVLGMPIAMDLIKRAYAMIFEHYAKKRRDRIEADRVAMKEALEELKKAQTEDEIDAAVEKIGRSI